MQNGAAVEANLTGYPAPIGRGRPKAFAGAAEMIAIISAMPGEGLGRPVSRSGPASNDGRGPRDHNWLSVQPRCPLDLLDRLPSVDVDMPRTLDNMIGYDVATVVVAAWKQFRRRHRVVA